MLKFAPLELKDQDSIKEFLDEWRFESASLVFSNFFIWRKDFRYRYCIVDDYLFIEYDWINGKPFCIVPIPKRTSMGFCPAITMLENYLKEQGREVCLTSITEPLRRRIDICCPGRFEYKEIRDSEDYVYNTQDLIKLQGRRYHGKRNHVNKFMSCYEFEYIRLTSADMEACMRLYDTWAQIRGYGDEKQVMNEKQAIYEALYNMEALNIKGGAFRIDGEIRAFTLGTQLNPHMAVVHVEKADERYSGIYAAINQQFVKNEWSDMRFINREEDMGIMGLRRAKLSYNPVRLVRKYNARLCSY
ncbi:MAG: DUF2156 domain-containing protein [Christensenellales bacterium]|jgi:hypothetical protein